MKKLSTMFMALLLLCGGMNLLAQTNRFTNGTEGTEFWFSFPICWQQSGGNNALKIYVSCEVATECTLEIPGLGKKIVKTTKPHDVIDFTLLPSEGQPYEKNDSPTAAKTEEETFTNGKGRGIHVYADVPITVYGVSRFVYTSDSFIALPTSSLGTEYIVASYADVTAPFPGQHLPSQTVIVAAYDSTTVTFKLGGSQGTQTVGGMTRGQTKTFVLNKGDLVAFANKKLSDNSVYFDLSGSKITSDKPIAVTSGNQCAYVPVDKGYCDFVMEMELPTNTWGKEYHVTRFIKRKNYSFMKIFAKNPNTKLYRDGNTLPFAVLTTSGGNQGTGYYEGRILDDGLAPRPIVIKGDGPISITVFNAGQTDDNVSSDPFQLVLTPIEQYQKEITFNTPGIKGGQGFKENYVNLVFEGNSNNEVPDDMEFGRIENDTVRWTSVRNTFGAAAELFKGFAGDTKKYSAKIITLPGDGVYRFRALKPFAAYAYGFDSYDSYAHPTSLITNDLTVNDTLPPIITINSNDSVTATFTVEDVIVGRTAGSGDNVLNAATTGSKLARVFLNAEKSFNYRLKTDVFIPGQAQTANGTAEVIDRSKDAKAEIVVVDRAGNHSLKTLSYKGKLDTVKGPIFTVSYQDFGVVAVPNQKEITITIYNIGDTTGTILSHTLPKLTEFTIENWPSFPVKIAAHSLIKLKVVFRSESGGDFSDQIIFTSALGDSLIAKLHAKVIQPTIIANVLDFGTIKINEEKTANIVLENIGTDSVQVIEIWKPAYYYAFSAIEWPNSFIVAPGSTYQLPVRFSFAQPGTFNTSAVFKTKDYEIKVFMSGTVVGPSAIERVYDPSFNISPNPATGFTTINLPSFKSQNPLLKVYDALGNEVADFTGKVTGNYSSFNFDTRLLPNGAYFVRLTDGAYTLIRTFIVNN